MFNAVGPLGKSILDRRKQARLGEHDTWLASAEDVAVLKAFSDRPRDLDDLVALLQVTPLDLNYVSQWAERLDASIESNEVSERLRSARAKAKH